MTLSIFFSTPGTYTIDDDGIRGNNTSVVRDGSGNILFPFTHPSDTISFIAEVPGITFIFNTADSFGTADVVVGSLSDPNLSPDAIVVKAMRTDGTATLVSNGTITEGGIDTPADLIAAVTVLSAVNGIGTATNALEIQTTFLEAETTDGGINLANFGQLQIGLFLRGFCATSEARLAAIARARASELLLVVSLASLRSEITAESRSRAAWSRRAVLVLAARQRKHEQ